MPFRSILRGPLLSWAIFFASQAGLHICAAQKLRYLSHQSWSTEDGLPQSSVHSIAQTQDGYLWIATEGGLVRFDGVNFRVFDHTNEPVFTSDDICCLATGPSGDLLIGTKAGAVQLQEKKFIPYTAKDGFTFPHPQQAGPWHWTTGEIEFVHAEDKRLWRTAYELPAGRITAVSIDREDLAWVGMNNGLVVVDAQTNVVTRIASLTVNSVLSVFEDAEDNHWIGTETSGLHLLRRLKFRSEPALVDKATTSVTQTKDAAIWIGTRDDGLRRLLNGTTAQPVPGRALTSPVILCLAPATQGGLWAGTPDGLNYIDAQGAVRQYNSANGLPDDYIRSLVSAKGGAVWVGTRHGLVHLSGSAMRTFTAEDGLGSELIGSLLLTSNGDLWAATSGGLSRINAEGRITNFTTASGLATSIVTAIAQDDEGDIWAATKDGGLSLFNGDRFIPAIGTAREASHKRSIDAMVADRSGSLWLRMDRGIARITLSALHNCITHGPCSLDDDSIAKYGRTDGLPNDEVVPGGTSAAWLTSAGELWFPTRGGVAVADTARMSAASPPPPVVLQRVLLDDAPQNIDSGPVEFAYGHTRLTLEYAALTYSAPFEIRYRVRLDGFDKNWIDAGNRRSATYTNLPPGTYTFQVQALSNEGTWSGNDVALRLRITPPYYRRWWFIGLVALGLLAVLAGIYLLRLRRLRQQFAAVLAERNRMAREIHDTLTQDFVGTSLQLDILAQQLGRGQVEKALEQVKRARRLVTEGLAEARQSIWELRANNSQDTLPARLTRLVQRESFATLSPRLHVGGAYRALDPRTERELLRLTQEALQNVHHHAHASETSVNLFYSSDALMLTVQDNGLGFALDKASLKEGHYGLLGMKERAAVMDGTLEIVSQPGRGTTINLRVPLGPAKR